MQVDDMEFSSRFYLSKAVSLLMANRPHLLRFTDPDDPKFHCWTDPSARDLRLMSLAHFIMGERTVVDFFGPSQDMAIEDLESLIFALEVVLSGRMREEEDRKARLPMAR